MYFVCSCGSGTDADVEDGLNYVICSKCGREYEIEVTVSQISSDDEEEEK